MMRVLLVLALGLLGTVGSSQAAVVFVIDSATFGSNGSTPITGVVDVYVNANGDDVGAEVLGWTATVMATNFTGSITSVTLGPAQDPVAHPDLFPGTPVLDTSFGGNVTGNSSIFDISTPELFDGAGLMSFAFTVPTGQFGTFDLVFSTDPPFISDITRAELGNPSFNPSFSGATITAVPEPSSMLALGALGVGCGARLYRRRKSLRAA